MSTSITTNADLLTRGDITDNEIKRITTQRMRSDNWASMHIRGWSEVLRRLELRPTPLTESDLGDTTELKQTTVYFVLYYAYAQAESGMPGKGGQAQLYWDRGIRAMAEVTLTGASGGTIPRSSYGFRRAVRA